MYYIGIDPGPEMSAYCILYKNGSDIRVASKEKIVNEGMLNNCKLWGEDIRRGSETSVGIEMIASYGMPVGAEVFETCVWIGRFIEALGVRVKYIYRREEKINLCGSMKAKDANIRQALIDRFGAPGTKKAPGITYGITKDIWAALAVAVVLMDKENFKARCGNDET